MSLLYEVIALIITSLLLGGTIGTVQNYKESTALTYTLLDEDVSETVLSSVDSYHYAEVKGSIVVSAIKRFQNDYDIAVTTTTAVSTYPTADYSVPNIFGSVSYIDPNSTFIGIVFRDANGVATNMTFTDITMFDSNSVTAEDLSYAKQLIVTAIQDGVSTSMSWEQITDRLEDLVYNNSRTNSEYIELMEYLQEQIDHYIIETDKLRLEQSSAGTEQTVIDSIITVAGFVPGTITTWSGVEKIVDDLRTEISILNANLNDTTKLVTEYPNLVAELESLQDSIKAAKDELLALEKQYNDLMTLLADAKLNLNIGNVNTDSNNTSIANLESFIVDTNNKIATANANIISLNNQITSTRTELNATLAEAEDWNNKYMQQLARTKEYTDKTNEQIALTNKYKPLYEAQALITKQWQDIYNTNNGDLNSTINILKQWLGALYNGSKNVPQNIDTLITSFAQASQLVGVAGNSTLESFDNNFSALVKPIVDNIITMNGYVDDPNTIAGIIAGIKTIPVGFPAGNHVHDANCYNGWRHSHTESCKSYYSYSYTCSGCQSSTSYHNPGCVKEWYGWVTCTACGGTGVNNGSRCGCMDGEPYGWYTGSRMVCNGHTSYSCPGHTGTDYNYICGKNTYSYYTSTGAVATEVCNTIVKSIDIVRNPLYSTSINNPINTTGMLVLATYYNESRGYIGNYNVSGATNSKGAKSGTVTYTGLINNGTTTGNKTTTFSYNVE